MCWVCPAARLAEEEEEADLQPPGCSNETGMVNEAATEGVCSPQPSVAASAGGMKAPLLLPTPSCLMPTYQVVGHAPRNPPPRALMAKLGGVC